MDTGSMESVEHVPARSSVWFNRRALLTALFAAAMLISALAGSWISAPFAVAFAVTAYLWHQSVVAPRQQDGTCGGCSAGCVGCHERIDTPARDKR